MRHVVVTGGAGFIGSHLCEGFLRRGYAVTAVDNFLTGRAENLERAARDPRFELIRWDVKHPLPATAMRQLARHGLQGVLHFAGTAAPTDVRRTPFELLETTSHGTLNTVDLALRHGARYVLASAPERIADDQTAHRPFDRGDARRFAEACVTTAMSGRGLRAGREYRPLDAAIARIGSTYGPRMRGDDGRATPEICRRALRGETLSEDERGAHPPRKYLYVDDLVDGVIRLFESGIRLPVDFGGGYDCSASQLMDLARRAARRVPSAAARSAVTAARASDDESWVPARAQRRLLWAPRTPLPDGLARTLDWFRRSGAGESGTAAAA